ncbi:hypothetical protein Syun_021945 [Stephania yunnanensis]|uniref:Uncharacterized protein n=1 Tax=Stephania yunnanensis TaxID=152371 RepID=A0AAP0NQ56_9MAGN
MLSLASPWTAAKAEVSESASLDSVESEVGAVENMEIDELDLIPLNDRLKMLVRSGGRGGEEGGRNGSVSNANLSSAAAAAIGVVGKKEEGGRSSSMDVALDQASLQFIGEGKGVEPYKEHDHMENVGERNASGLASSSSTVEYGTSETCADDLSCSSLATYSKDKEDFVDLIKVEGNDDGMAEPSIYSSSSVEVKCGDSNTVSLNKEANLGCLQKADEGYGAKTETDGDVGINDLDHIPLLKRHKALVSRVPVETTDQVSSLAQFNLMTGVSHCNSVSVKEESQYVAENDFHSTSQNLTSKPSQSLVPHSLISEVGALCSSPPCIPSGRNYGKVLSPKSCSFRGVQDNKKGFLPEITTVKSESDFGNAFTTINHDDMPASDLPTFPAKIKIENLEDGSASFSDNNMGKLSYYCKILLKSETVVYDVSSEDILDHLTLLQRMRLLIPKKCLNLLDTGDLKCTRKSIDSTHERSPAISESHTTRGISYRRKRKRTATDSVETALEEDAPGLLKVLTDKGIAIDEMKLYGDPESADLLDASTDDDSFQDLEAVMSKMFNTGASIIKFASERCPKGSKRSYCLGCLISLVEQTRYLRFRKWPVEWGWCRDLQSFIFVFERHNRIVLERPEYGYATYFFELVDSLTIDWQVKRLVTAMKLSSCGRANLIENKSLVVGEDLTEAEAKVLEEYGWTRNSGLASMLNYCDRVIHDRNKDRDVSEWRSKIGKLLMDGINGGVIVLANLPNKFMGPESSLAPEIKLELI